VLRYGIPLGCQSYADTSSYSATELVCSTQPYGTVPYSYGTLDAWPLPLNRMAAAPASQPTTVQYSHFPDTGNFISSKEITFNQLLHSVLTVTDIELSTEQH